MSRWLRLYDDLVDDPKVQRLPGEMFKALINLWCITSQNDGVLPPSIDIAFKLRISLSKVEATLAGLRNAGLIDDDGNGSLAPHNWDGRQFKSDVSTERVKRFRKRPRNVSVTVSETPTETAPETEQNRAESEQKKDAADAAPSVDPEKDLFRRGKEVSGDNSGGLIAKLLKAKKGNVSLARAAVEMAATKQNPREYLGAVIAGGHPSAEGKRLTNDQQFFGVGRLPGVL